MAKWGWDKCYSWYVRGKEIYLFLPQRRKYFFYLAWVFLYKYSKRYGTLQRHYYFAFPTLHVKICLRVCSTRVMGLVTFSKSPSYTLSPTHHSLGCKPIPASEPSIARTIRLPATGFSSNRTRSKSQKGSCAKYPHILHHFRFNCQIGHGQ